MTASMQLKWPSKCILIGKTDLDGAYRCVHANSKIAPKCIAIVEKLSLLLLKLPFGPTTVLEEYTTISEVEIYLGNILLMDTSCDVLDIQSPHRSLLPREEYLSDSTKILQVDTLSVNIESK